MIKNWSYALSVGILMIAADVQAASLKIAFEDVEQSPYVLGNTAAIDAEKPGIHVELVRTAAAELKIDLTLQRMPWKRQLALLETGQIDGLFSASFKEDRLAIGVYPMKDGKPDASLMLDNQSYSLYRQTGGKVGWDGQSLTGFSGAIGAPGGYSIVDDLRKLGATVQEGANTNSDLMKLLAGRVEAVAALDVVGDALLEKPQFAGKVEKVTPPLVTKPYYLMLSHQLVKADPDLARKFWETLAAVRARDLPALAVRYAD